MADDTEAMATAKRREEAWRAAIPKAALQPAVSGEPVPVMTLRFHLGRCAECQTMEDCETLPTLVHIFESGLKYWPDYA